MKLNLTYLTLLIFVLNISLFGTDYFVSPSGNNSTGNGTINNPWGTIEYAIENVYSGDILYLRGGIYNEQLFSVRDGTTNGYITISAYQDEEAFIDGTGVESGNNGAIITHSYLKLIGFTIQNWADNGMEINNCEFIELLKIKVTSTTGGIHLTGTIHDFVMDSCIMYDYYGGAGGFGFDATPEGVTDSIYNGVIKNSKAFITIGAFDNCDGFALGHDGVSNIYFYNCEVYGVGDAFDISGKDITLERCLAHNSNFGGGYKLWRDNVLLINCIGYNNISNVELDFDFDANKGVKARMINCTFFSSQVYNIWIENSAGGSKLEMYNCILAGGNNTGLSIDGDSISCYTGDYNLFHMSNNPDRMVVTSEYDFSLTQVLNGEWTAYSGQDTHTQVVFNSSNLFVDTLSINPNLHLVEGALAIDNGLGLPDAPSFDFDNCPRNVGQIDIGAYEFDACGAVGISDEVFENIHSYYLAQNYPNPFNPTTSIEYRVASTEYVTLKVYDVLGREVATFVNEERRPGNYEVVFNPVSSNQHLASGIYFYQLKAGDFVATKKMILLK
jgi:hypothetical protein